MQVIPIRSDGCLSYVLLAGGEAVIVDPARDTGKYLAVLREQAATLRFVVDTHTHADHLSGARKLADETGARLVMSAACEAQWRAAAGKGDALGIGDILRANGGVVVDHPVQDGECLALGGEELRFLAAPGHTLDSVVVAAGDRIFTGDTLMVGQTGRCDLPGGDGASLHDTLFRRLAAFPDATFVYPGHDYEGRALTALGLERASSRFFRPRSRDEFQAFLTTAFPTLTGAGMQCGASTTGSGAGVAAACDSRPADPLRDEVAERLDAYFFAKQPGDFVSPEALARELAVPAGAPRPLVLDVREASEWEQGRIAGAVRVSVHEIDRRIGEVPAARTAPVVTVCRSGKRSGWAAMFLRVAGFREVRNLDGGMLAWEKAGLPVERS